MKRKFSGNYSNFIAKRKVSHGEEKTFSWRREKFLTAMRIGFYAGKSLRTPIVIHYSCKFSFFCANTTCFLQKSEDAARYNELHLRFSKFFR